MKQKIINALKTKYANRGFSDKAFDGVADFLSKTVTEDSQVEDAVTGIDGLLKAFQGEVDKVRGEKTAIQKELDELKAKGDGGESKPQPKADEDLDVKLQAMFDAKVKPIQDELAAYKAKETASARQNLITSKAKDLGIPEWRIKQGFTIAEDADEASIGNALAAIQQDIVTAGLGTGSRFPLQPESAPSDADIDEIRAMMRR